MRELKFFNCKINLKENEELDETVALVGNKIFNGIYFPGEEIAKAYQTIIGKPLNLDHSDKVEDEIGFIKNAKFENNELKVIPVLVKDTAKYDVALGFIKARKMAGATAEVSVGVWMDINQEEVNGEIIKVGRNLEFDHLAIVTRGACSPLDGCGIGKNIKFDAICENTNSVTVNFSVEEERGDVMETENKEIIKLGVVPDNPPKYDKVDDEAWEAPQLQDFTDKQWEELTDEEKKEIASCFAWTPKNPPDKFTDMKLPHHRAKDKAVVWRGVVAAMAALMGARGGVDIPREDKKRVYNHLAAHYEEFEKEPPEFSEEKEWVGGYIVTWDNATEKCNHEEIIEGLKEEIKRLNDLLKEKEKEIEELKSKGKRLSVSVDSDTEEIKPYVKKMLKIMG